MGFDGLFMRVLLQELREELVGLKIEKINQPQRGAFVFSFRGKQLLISVEPSAAYLSLTSQKMPNPQEPPMFCMLLRKYLLGAALTDIRQEQVDRTAYFVFSALNSAFEMTERTLVAEIMGRHANLLLLDENRRIIDCIKRSALDSRQALPGLIYEPFSDPRKNIFIAGREEDGGKNARIDENTPILKEYQGFSKLSAEYVSSFPERQDDLLSPASPVRGYTCADRDGTVLDFYYLPEALMQKYPGCDVTEYSQLSEATNAFFMRSLHAIQLKKIAGDLKKTLSSRLERIEGKIEKMQNELEIAKHSDHYRTYGDILLANAFHIPQGANPAQLVDFEGKDIEIPMDTRLSVTENAQKYYFKYKKSVSAVQNIAIQIAEARADREYLAHALVMADHAENEEDIRELRKELEEYGFVSKKENPSGKAKGKVPKNGKPHLHVHRYVLSSGKSLLIGRSNTANDTLTMKYASNSDYWLHTNTIPGSHCIIRCEGEEPTDADLEEAARAAAYYSKARESSKVAVDYCRVRFVKKIPGAKPGMVTYSNFKTVFVDPKISGLRRG